MQISKKLLTAVIVISFYSSNEYCFSAIDSLSKRYYSKIKEGKNHLLQSNLDSAVFCYNEALLINDYAFLKHVRQAAVIACFNNDFHTAKELLEKCLDRGESPATLQYFKKFKKLESLFVQKKSFNGCNLSLHSHDSVFYKYLRINVHDRLIHSYLFIYSKDSIKDAFLSKQQSLWLSEVMELFSNKTYPPLNSILNNQRYILDKSNKCNVDRCNNEKSICFELNNLEKPKHVKIKFKPFVRNQNGLSTFSYPLGEFFAHIAIDPIENHAFYELLDAGFNELKIPQELVGLVYEGVHQPEFDFMASLNSYGLRKHYFTNYQYLFSSANPQLDSIIDYNRFRYYMDDKQLQKELVLKLLEFDQGVIYQAFTPRELRNIRYLFNLFASYSSL